MPTTIIPRLLFLFVLLALPAATASLRSGSQTCPSSGTKQLSTTATLAQWVSIQAPSGNSGVIAFGGSNVTVAASCAAAIGNCLGTSGSALLPPISNISAYNLSQIYIACANSGDSVMFNYLQ